MTREKKLIQHSVSGKITKGILLGVGDILRSDDILFLLNGDYVVCPKDCIGLHLFSSKIAGSVWVR